jgi:CP family cyanate transporter-like MFS transporter
LVKPAATMLALTWLVAFNLRSGLIGLGPSLPDIIADLGLSHAQASFLVAVPPLMMGIMAVPGGGWTDRRGPVLVIAFGLALVAVGGGLRAVAPDFALLLAATFVFGAGIGLSQPPLPRLMRGLFPRRLGVSTGIYASGLITGSITAASLTGPYLDRMADPAAWRQPFAFWGVVATLVFLLWVVALRPWRTGDTMSSAAADVRAAMVSWSPWRDRGAWITAALFAAQGLVYYLLVAWLPAIYHEAGLDAAATAGLFAVYNVATLPAILFFPSWSDRLGRRRPPIFVAAVLGTVGVVGLLVAPTAGPWLWAWPAMAGAAVSGLLAMSLVLPADIAPRGFTGAAAGMVLGIGYAASAAGPVIAGVVRDVTGSFQAALLLLVGLGIAMIALALVAPELPQRRAGQ